MMADLYLSNNAYLDYYSASSLEQQTVLKLDCRQVLVAPLRHVIQPIFALSPQCFVEKQHKTYFTFFGLTGARTLDLLKQD